MKTRILILTTRLTCAGILASALFVGVTHKSLAAAPPVDPAHAAHVASGAMPPDAAKGEPALAQQISELQTKVTQLEATLAKHPPAIGTAPAAAAMPGMTGAPASAAPAMAMGMEKMKAGAAMPGMEASAAPAPAMAGMSDPAASAPAGGAMNMMGMMSQMMGMMDKMMPMGGTSAPMPAGSMAPAATPMSGMGMGSDKMEMAGMMGMSAMNAAAPGAMPQSALPGYPGASHLYHIGATGFFLDHPQHIALTTEQQAALNKAKEQALLAKSTADRAIQQAEQELWTLTAADQPDATAIQAKIAAIGKLTGDQRLAFIRAVGDASKVLTDEQRKALAGFAAPASATPAAAPMPGMKGM
ncbi:MAG: periplasmic heavy metal sensor [Opitutaceae bacterium]|nr:periplasmic heavy metal sensor [Opitutaceae bacterium]